MTLKAVAEALAPEYLGIFGLCHAIPEDGIGDGTICLLGPSEPGFWPHVTAGPEFHDGAPDPLDRWSNRVISRAAAALGATPIFPFGSPVRPFMTWALRTGRSHVSPVRLLVHDRAGLWVSFRGALLLPERIDLPTPGPSPCDTCPGQPCRTVCPVGALTGRGYDLDACHAYLGSERGQSCMTMGCAVRRACPAGADYARLDAQSAFHMREFHK